MGRRQHRRPDEKYRMTLDMVKRTASRDPMPRPAVFKDKTKYDRNRAKQAERRDDKEEG